MGKGPNSSEKGARSDSREERAEMREMVKSMEYINKDLEQFRKDLGEVLAENKQLKKENECLRKKCEENEKRIKDLEKMFVHNDQYSRKSNLEIKGVIQTEAEDVVELVGKIGTAVGEPVSPLDIEACHRVSARNARQSDIVELSENQETKKFTASNIVVQFRSRRKRDQVLEKSRKKRITNESLTAVLTVQIALQAAIQCSSTNTCVQA